MLGCDHYSREIQASHDYFPQFSSLAFRGCDSLEQFVSVTVEKDTRFSQVHSPSDTAKKCDPEFGLQLVDLIRYVRLAHMEFLGCPGKARMSSNRLEDSEPCYGDCGRWVRALGLFVVWHKRFGRPRSHN